MTRVLVDLLFMTGMKGGMESYVRNVYSRMATDQLEFVAFVSSELARTDMSWFPGSIVDSGISGENRAAWAWGELTSVPLAARRSQARLIHSPANVGPLRSAVPVVLTVHDLLPFRHPEFVPGRYAPLLRTLIRGAARNATRVLTVSESSKRDIVDVLRKDAEVVDAVHLAGPGADGAPPTRREPATLLSLGNRMPHKNFGTLIRALARIPESARPELIVSGSHGDDPLAPLVRELGLERWVALREWVSDAELEALYSTVTAMILPSLFEGFGLPMLESMARGCPVLCSDLPVLREVGADAAVYFDPSSEVSIAAAIEHTLHDSDLLDALSSAGRCRASSFSWDHTAQLTADSFQRALS